VIIITERRITEDRNLTPLSYNELLNSLEFDRFDEFYSGNKWGLKQYSIPLFRQKLPNGEVGYFDKNEKFHLSVPRRCKITVTDNYSGSVDVEFTAGGIFTRLRKR